MPSLPWKGGLRDAERFTERRKRLDIDTSKKSSTRNKTGRLGFFHRAEKRTSAFLLRVFEDLRRRALFMNLALVEEAHAIILGLDFFALSSTEKR